MTKIAPRFLNHLLRRRILVWAGTLLLIFGFAAGLFAILWTSRMRISRPAEIGPGEIDRREKTITVSIPAARFRAIEPGEPVTITPDGGSKLKGTVRSVVTGPDRIELTITVQSLPEETTEGVITLRAERLISAFLHR